MTMSPCSTGQVRAFSGAQRRTAQYSSEVSIPAEPWKPVQIRSLGAQDLRVSDIAGELASVSIRDVVPLSADR